jgi:heat shock protein 4
LGIRNLDAAVITHLSKKFEDKFKVGNPDKAFKTRNKIRDAVEKARKILTADQQAPINVDCVMEDTDMSELLKREDF